MIVITPKYYKNFKCIAGECPDSCCQGWEVDADEESLEYYKTLPNSLEIKRRIDNVLDKDEFDNTIFRLAPKKRCPFLNDENLCDMHIAIGGEHTPITCRNFPRFIYDFGGTREIGISFSCPVAADLIYHSEESLDFDTEINSDLPTLNDIDAELFIKIKQARTNAFKIVQNPEKPLNKRLSELLEYSEELQRSLDDF
ncbi:MAG: flagellin lysine-N-methylase, partial [Eubacterium sp.]|nr:flagellin lysine-N-methylase [Eubacterium sp.]